MKKLKTIFFSVAVLSLCFFASSSLLAGAVTADDGNYDLSGANDKTPTDKEYEWTGGDLGTKSDTSVNCDDFYQFGSITSEIKSEKDTYKSGEEITFKGKIRNENNYPIVNGNLYVQILRGNKEGVLINGDHIVDEFFAQDNISLSPKGEKDVEFKWRVPANSIDGGYSMATFFTVNKKYNLAGLSFWNHTYAGFSDFKVTGLKDGVSFNRNKVTVNGKAFELRSMSEPLPNDKPINVKVPLQNKTAKVLNLNLSYKLYYWDSLQQINLLDSKKENVSLAPGASKDISYVINNSEKPVYYLTITAEGEGVKSVINVRPTTTGSQVRLNFSGIDNFPVNKGDKLTSFVCFHNTSFAGEMDTKIEQIIRDKNGTVVDKLEYQGMIGGSIGAAKNDVTAIADYEYLTVETKVYGSKGDLIEENTLVYDCSLFDKDYCAKQSVVEPRGASMLDWLTGWKGAAVAAVIVALISIIVFITVRNKRKSSVIVAMIVGAFIVTTFMANTMPTFSYQVTDRTGGGAVDMELFRTKIWNNIVYNLNLNQVGVNLSDGQTLTSNSNINFVFDKNGEWGRLGGGIDTPPVSWDTWGGAGCSNYYFSGGSCENEGWWGFVRCNTPTVKRVVKVSGPVTCYDTYCTVDDYTTPGNPIVVKTEISRTDCGARLYAKGTGSNGSSCASSCNDGLGGDTNVCTSSDGTACHDSTCACNDNGAGEADNCPYPSSCRMEEEKAYPNFVPANAVNWTFYYPVPSVCGDGVKEGSEQCDLGDATHGDGNGACPKDCSSSCVTNTECPCVGADCGGGGGGVGTSCTVATNCQEGLCCNTEGTCAANCDGNEGACGADVPGKTCCSDKTWRTDCNCLTEPSSTLQQCCTVDRIWREKCTGCERDNQCATSRAECCSEEFGTCTVDQTYCVDADFNLISDGDIAIYLTANPGEHSGSTRVKVTSAGGFHKDIEFSPISTSPDSGLKNGMLNWLSMFNPTPLTSTGYGQGSIVTVKVPYDIIPIGTSKTYKMMIKGVADEIEKVKEITVKIYGQGWSQP